MEKTTKICFVCSGNIVRSPLAEGLFIHTVNEAGVAHRYEVDSAGTGPWHVGERPDRRMRQVAAERGLRYDGRARQFKREDMDRFDLILAMDRDNWAHLKSMAITPEHHKKIRMLREFDPQGGSLDSVPDPYYGGMDGFERTYDMIARSVDNLLRILEQDGSESVAKKGKPSKH